MEKKSFGASAPSETPAPTSSSINKDGRLRISAWKTTDGEVFTEAALAREHQKKIDRIERIHKVLLEMEIPIASELRLPLAEAIVANRDLFIKAIR